MSSGFVSGGTADEPIERDDEWVKAQQEIEATRRRKEEENRQGGGKTLYETLQANKAAKQEAFEESIRLKNQFRSLDEDEVEFLDSVLESTRAKEAEIKKETTEQLDLFRRQQEEADKAFAAEAADGNLVSGGSPTEEEQWAVSGKKRRRAKEKQVLKGVKLRKMSSTSEAKPTQADERPSSPKEESPATTQDSRTLPDGRRLSDTKNETPRTTGKDDVAESATISPIPYVAAITPATRSVGALGLDEYSSDDGE